MVGTFVQESQVVGMLGQDLAVVEMVADQEGVAGMGQVAVGKTVEVRMVAEEMIETDPSQLECHCSNHQEQTLEGKWGEGAEDEGVLCLPQHEDSLRLRPLAPQH